MKMFLLLFVLNLYLPQVGIGQVTSNVLQRVFAIRCKDKDKFGTAFTIDVDGAQYLITAKHVAGDLTDGDEVELLHEKAWKKIPIKTIPLDIAEVDISVLACPFQISPALTMDAESGGMLWGQQVYFLGFPYMMASEVPVTINRGFPMPFIKSGVMSAMEFQNEKGYSIIYVDGHNNPGFSGGPLVWSPAGKPDFRVAGVVSGYRANPDLVLSKNQKTELTALGNSGILIAYGITPAINAIRKHPIGAKIVIPLKNDGK